MNEPHYKSHNNKNIPVYDFFEDHDLDTAWGIGNSLDDLIFLIEDRYFLRWEAVVREEQGVPLTEKQEDALYELVGFEDMGDDEPILSIDEMHRPCEPWFVTLNKVVPKLILDPFETYEIQDEVYHEGWINLENCLRERASDLSLPEGITQPINVIPEDILHRLYLQNCFDEIYGLGQHEELTLENEEQRPWRIEGFIEALKEEKSSAKYFNLTIEKLFELVKLPSKDEDILIKALLEEFGLKSVTEEIYSYL